MLKLDSRDIPHDGSIPVEHTHDGHDRSPPLRWSGAPDETRAFALVAHDPDAEGDRAHWVVYDLPPQVRGLEAGAPAGYDVEGGAQGRNDFGGLGWRGPDLEPGPPHRYVFELHALDAPLRLPPGSNRLDVERAMAGHVLETALLVGHYQRPVGGG